MTTHNLTPEDLEIFKRFGYERGKSVNVARNQDARDGFKMYQTVGTFVSLPPGDERREEQQWLASWGMTLPERVEAGLIGPYELHCLQQLEVVDGHA